VFDHQQVTKAERTKRRRRPTELPNRVTCTGPCDQEGACGEKKRCRRFFPGVRSPARKWKCGEIGDDARTQDQTAVENGGTQPKASDENIDEYDARE
jgi:hypothetical protein